MLGSPAWAQTGSVTVRYTTPSALRGLDVTLRIDRLGIAEVTTSDIGALRSRVGIAWVHPTIARRREGNTPAFIAAPALGEWQYHATRANIVPSSVVRAAAAITIAVVDTGADLAAPGLAAKNPIAYSAVSGDGTVTDLIGHGTFVASLAGASVTNGTIFDGFGGDARLMIVQANSNGNDFTDANEAAAIVWAVDHGAKIINLSLGGRDTSEVEQDAIAYAGQHGALLVAAAGNDGQRGNPPTYPAAILGPTGLAVGASTNTGTRAAFSTAGTYVSLLAPGVNVLGAIASTAPASAYPQARLVGDTGGVYGYGTGTSYAAPEVAGAAALVWGANPSLTAAQVMRILERSASQKGAWSPAYGFGVLDVAAAVAAAQGRPAPPVVKPVTSVVTIQPVKVPSSEAKSRAALVGT
jgi:subtilisin family serine protease